MVTSSYGLRGLLLPLRERLDAGARVVGRHDLVVNRPCCLLPQRTKSVDYGLDFEEVIEVFCMLRRDE